MIGKSKQYYSEVQNFANTGWWIFIAIVFTFALAPISITLYKQLAVNETAGEGEMYATALIAMILLLFIVLLGTYFLFKSMKLVVEIRSDGLYYRYPPFILKMRSFHKNEIRQYEIRKYRPIRDYNGWGIRYSWSGAGRAFSVQGKTGLQLYLTNGKKVLFGTQRPDALIRAMHKMKGEE